MERELTQELTLWKNRENRMPIILRGARQVGKSFLIEQFGLGRFDNLVTLNFEFEPKFKQCFQSLDPNEINTLIFAMTGKKIVPGKTLLFLDEIQECPNAILALRYYKEKLPKLHVIAAGSLLEFVINDEQFRMPVGRIQYLYLKPLSFKEFLQISKNDPLLNYIKRLNLNHAIPNIIHDKLLELLKLFFILGGMPAVLSEYFSTQDIDHCQNIQSAILNTYKNDFAKYANKTNIKYLQKLFIKAPNLVGKQFKYVDVERSMRSRDIKTALEMLSKANIIFPVYASNASGLPLNALINEKRFKLLFLDIGLLTRTTNLNSDILLSNNLLLVNRGTVAEQFVGQELLSYINPYNEPEIFYWENPKSGSQAEVDYVINDGSRIIPIEVKAGTTGRLKSLMQFMRDKKSLVGIRISQSPLKYKNGILSVPLYAISELPRLINEILA